VKHASLKDTGILVADGKSVDQLNEFLLCVKHTGLKESGMNKGKHIGDAMSVDQLNESRMHDHNTQVLWKVI